MVTNAREIVELLELERLDLNLFRGPQPETMRQRTFGGQVAGQAVMAAIRCTDDDFVIHSLHSYFLRPGDNSIPIIYDVADLRDGNSFVTRRVTARQHGLPIFHMTASFQRPEEGFEHADAMPQVNSPDEAMPIVEMARQMGPEAFELWRHEWGGLDARYIGTSAMGLPQDPDHPARARLWIRTNGEIGDDPHLNVAAFTFASDLTLLSASLVPHGVGIESPDILPASLDHSIWFHRPFRADEWWLYDQVSPAAQGGRGLSLAKVYTQSGELVATVAQEGLIRRRRPKAE